MSELFRVLTREECEDLKWEMHSSLPGSAKIYYVLSNHLDSLLAGFEVIVDKWPKWTSIILRPSSNDSVPLYFHNYYMCHTKSTKDLKFFLQRPGVVDWEKPAIFTGVPYDITQVIQEKSRKERGHVASVEHRFMYAWVKAEPPEPVQAPHGLELTSLTPEHADLVHNHWKHYRLNEGLTGYFKQIIQDFDSSAMVTPSGHLVAYICMQYNGSMANLFVDPDYRSQNLGQLLLQDLTRKLHTKHHTAYGFIRTKDADFIATCQAMGFSWVAQGSMSWVHHQPQGVTCSAGRATGRCSSFSWSPRDSVSEDCEMREVSFNAMPLSCNECSGIPVKERDAGAVHSFGT